MYYIWMLGGIEGAVENSFCAVRFLQTLFDIESVRLTEAGELAGTARLVDLQP